MKYINKILSLFVIALIATSCDPDAEKVILWVDWKTVAEVSLCGQLHPNGGS